MAEIIQYQGDEVEIKLHDIDYRQGLQNNKTLSVGKRIITLRISSGILLRTFKAPHYTIYIILKALITCQCNHHQHYIERRQKGPIGPACSSR